MIAYGVTLAVLLALWDTLAEEEGLPPATLYYRRVPIAVFSSPLENNLSLCREAARELRESRNSKGYWCQA